MINSLSLADKLFLILLCCSVTLFPLLLLMIRWDAKKAEKESEIQANNTVNHILEQASEPSRQRWTADEEIQFVYLIVGSTDKSKHLVWARITIRPRNISATIEYADGISADTWKFAQAIERQFKVRSIAVELSSRPSPQPDLKETGVSWKLLKTNGQTGLV